jgi:hypothetical protein
MVGCGLPEHVCTSDRAQSSGNAAVAGIGLVVEMVPAEGQFRGPTRGMTTCSAPNSGDVVQGSRENPILFLAGTGKSGRRVVRQLRALGVDSAYVVYAPDQAV